MRGHLPINDPREHAVSRLSGAENAFSVVAEISLRVDMAADVATCNYNRFGLQSS
ncbi:MAG: hypothetical protein OXC26_19490 [Albidovulum sp.]|nr:hypothetical protein [Albidovulum sp.]